MKVVCKQKKFLKSCTSQLWTKTDSSAVWRYVCSSVCWNVKWVKDIRGAQLHAAWLASRGVCLTFRDPNRVIGDPWWRSLLCVACLDLFCVPAYDILSPQIPTNKKIDQQVD